MKGKVGIVTGGGSGIGEGIVRRLLDDGARVYAFDRDAAALDRLAAEFAGGGFAGVVGDVTDAAASANLVERCVHENGRIDYLVNAAGVMHPAVPLSELSTDDYDRVQAVNLKGAFLFYRAASRAMLVAGKGSIVNIASTGGIRPVAMAGGYVASKFGMIGLSMSAALETAGKGVRVNAVCPGVIDTPLFRANVSGGPAEQLVKAIPLQRLGQPAEIAAATVWLLSDEASYVTGVALPVDGAVSLV